jgi:hypothetical protein
MTPSFSFKVVTFGTAANSAQGDYFKGDGGNYELW